MSQEPQSSTLSFNSSDVFPKLWETEGTLACGDFDIPLSHPLTHVARSTMSLCVHVYMYTSVHQCLINRCSVSTEVLNEVLMACVHILVYVVDTALVVATCLSF